MLIIEWLVRTGRIQGRGQKVGSLEQWVVVQQKKSTVEIEEQIGVIGKGSVEMNGS